MYPVNQVILGGDSMLTNLDDIDLQILKMEAYRLRLKLLKDSLNYPILLSKKLIWDQIDEEISPMSNELRNRLLLDNEYVEIYNELQAIVLSELLSLVKSKIENTDRGRELLTNQLKVVRKLKSRIIDDTNKEMETFKRFKEYSLSHPEATYEEFIKSMI